MSVEGSDSRKIKSLKELNEAIAERGVHSAHIAAADSVRRAAIAEADRFYDSYVKEHIEANEQIDKEAASFILRRRKGILGRYGRTIRLSNGTIKVRIIPRSVVVPEDAKPVINFLDKKPGGEEYLRIEKVLDKRSLATIKNARWIRSLNGLGVKFGRSENITIQSSLDEKPTIISHRPYPNRT